jgi:phosphate transport system protein
MSANPGTGHRHFHDELSELKVRLLTMSGEAQDALGRAVDALLQRDGEAGAAVIAGDAKIDAMELEVEEDVIRLLATQQPMARDLRFLTAAMKIANDLERVGDHAVNIAQSAERLMTHRPIAPEPEIVEMAKQARRMLADALDAFVRGDTQAARSICRRDDSVDALHDSVFRILLTHMMEDPQTIGAGMNLFLVSRNLERVADLATNIAEDVVFLVEGKTIKHHAEERR